MAILIITTKQYKPELIDFDTLTFEKGHFDAKTQIFDANFLYWGVEID